jgi:hypothetical protein
MGGTSTRGTSVSVKCLGYCLFQILHKNCMFIFYNFGGILVIFWSPHKLERGERKICLGTTGTAVKATNLYRSTDKRYMSLFHRLTKTCHAFSDAWELQSGETETRRSEEHLPAHCSTGDAHHIDHQASARPTMTGKLTGNKQEWRIMTINIL